MDLLEELEVAFDALLTRNTQLAQENEELRERLKRETSDKAAIQAKVETLLNKVREKLG